MGRERFPSNVEGWEKKFKGLRGSSSRKNGLTTRNLRNASTTTHSTILSLSSRSKHSRQINGTQRQLRRSSSFSEWLKVTGLKLIQPFLNSFDDHQQNGSRESAIYRGKTTLGRILGQDFVSNSQEEGFDPRKLNFSNDPRYNGTAIDGELFRSKGGREIEGGNRDLEHPSSLTNQRVNWFKSMTEKDVIVMCRDNRVLKTCFIDEDGDDELSPSFLSSSSVVSRSNQPILLPGFRQLSKDRIMMMMRRSSQRSSSMTKESEEDTDEYFEKYHRKYEKIEKQVVRRDREQQLHERYKYQVRVQEERQKEINRQLMLYGKVNWDFVEAIKSPLTVHDGNIMMPKNPTTLSDSDSSVDNYYSDTSSSSSSSSYVHISNSRTISFSTLTSCM